MKSMIGYGKARWWRETDSLSLVDSQDLVNNRFSIYISAFGSELAALEPVDQETASRRDFRAVASTFTVSHGARVANRLRD
jgi:hypothetical protein